MADSTTNAAQQVFSFEEGDGKNKTLLGGKGANLCEMTQIGLKVPPGFVISTAACLDYLAAPQQGLPAGIMEQVRVHMAQIEAKTGKQFGGQKNPLLVSVRSGSAISMPGMMDTILNLGLNEDTLVSLIAQTHNERFGYDAYRRFIQLFGQVALGINAKLFDNILDAVKEDAGVKHDVALSAQHLHRVASLYLDLVQRETGKPFSQRSHGANGNCHQSRI
jgi:pyruvate,orthophosphate dikinase